MTVGSGCFRSVLAQFKRKQVLMTSVFLYQGESFATQDLTLLNDSARPFHADAPAS